jgi:ATP-dependent RNA helicase DeaD
MVVTFGDLGIKKHLSDLEKIGFTEPFPIQEHAIPIVLSGRDLIGQAQTGTGKTAAFGLPILEMIDERMHDTQALIIVPTRELAMQVAEELKKFSGGKARVTAVFGGESMLKQIRFLKNERQIVVATPGRLRDYMREQILPLNKVRFVVLDEADRMLDMGFIDDIRIILSQLPLNRQTLMFSATMPNQIVKLAHDFLKNPQRIVVSKDEISNVDVKQKFMEVHQKNKLAQLCNILSDKKKTIVFCGSKMGTRRLAEDLYMRGFDVEAIHGDMEQPQRTRVISDFKHGKCNILVATDVVARGIDVPTVERVISYDVPKDEMTYFHRIGRTARGGEKGVAMIFVSEHEKKEFNKIRSHTRVKIEKIEPARVGDLPIVRVMQGKSFGAHRKHSMAPKNRFGHTSKSHSFGYGKYGFRHRSGVAHRKRGRHINRR